MVFPWHIVFSFYSTHSDLRRLHAIGPRSQGVNSSLPRYPPCLVLKYTLITPPSQTSPDVQDRDYISYSIGLRSGGMYPCLPLLHLGGEDTLSNGTGIIIHPRNRTVPGSSERLYVDRRSRQRRQRFPTLSLRAFTAGDKFPWHTVLSSYWTHFEQFWSAPHSSGFTRLLDPSLPRYPPCFVLL